MCLHQLVEILLLNNPLSSSIIRYSEIVPCLFCCSLECGELELSKVDSEAEMVIKPSFLRWLWSYDLGSIQTLVTLLCLWIRHFTMIISAGGFKQAANSVDKNSKKSTGTLDHRKLLSKYGFLQPRSSLCKEKCADRPIFSVRRYLVTGG